MKSKRLTLESFKSVVKRMIKEEMTKVKQWNGTPEEISEALNLWPRNEKKPILGVEDTKWTFKIDGQISYGDTPIDALHSCATMCAQAEQETNGNMEIWKPILRYLTA